MSNSTAGRTANNPNRQLAVDELALLPAASCQLPAGSDYL